MLHKNVLYTTVRIYPWFSGQTSNLDGNQRHQLRQPCPTAQAVKFGGLVEQLAACSRLIPRAATKRNPDRVQAVVRPGKMSPGLQPNMPSMAIACITNVYLVTSHSCHGYLLHKACLKLLNPEAQAAKSPWLFGWQAFFQLS